MGAPWPNDAIPRRHPGGKRITDKDRQHWAFQPVSDPAPPAVKNAAWVKSPIDRFILAKLEEKQSAVRRRRHRS